MRTTQRICNVITRGLVLALALGLGFAFAWGLTDAAKAASTVVVSAAEEVDSVTKISPRATQAASASPYRVKDINQVTSPGYDLYPDYMTVAGDFLYFVGLTPETGRELWRSDGTLTGTFLLKDFYPGVSWSHVELLTQVGTNLFFRVGSDNGYYGEELWISDGTVTGTHLVKDIYPGTYGSSPVPLFNSDGILFFGASDNVSGRELWKSDGTLTGTVRVKDIVPGTGSSSPYPIAGVNGILFFSAVNSSNDRELWKSDGTPTGTVQVADINPSGSSLYDTAEAIAFNNRLFFDASNGVNGHELWQSDGTLTGTVMVKDINPGSSSTGIYYMTELDGLLYFSASGASSIRGLWRSDGTITGTVLVKNLQVRPISAVGDELFFAANDGVSGYELWKSDGTPTGTVLIKDIYPGSGSSFAVDDPIHGYYDTVVGDTFYFQANDGNGLKLWKSDGTETGTVVVKNIHSEMISVDIPVMINFKGSLYFNGDDGSSIGPELWKSDGTLTGTVLIGDFVVNAGADPQELTNVDDTLYFSAADGIHGRELWKSDGTEAGTVRVADILAGEGSSSPENLLNVGGTLFFTADDGRSGRELWRSDGTPTGTIRVTDISPGSASADPQNLAYANGMLYFNAYDNAGYGLWKSDGTAAGTVKVGSQPASSVNDTCTASLIIGNWRYFAGSLDSHGCELWQQNLTTGENNLVKDIYPGSGSSYPSELVNADGEIFFRANDGSTGQELWKSDGAADGTIRVTDFFGNTYNQRPRFLTALYDKVYFFATNDSHFTDFWKSDGTLAGTQVVEHFSASNLFWYPQYDIVNIDDELFLLIDHPGYGFEVWRSDGTTEGTRLAGDIFPGGGPSWPKYLTKSGNRIFLSANDGSYGNELWAFVLTPNLYLTKIAQPAVPVAPGSAVTYTLNFGYFGDMTATNVVITDVMPIGLSANWAYTATGNVHLRDDSQFIWDVDDLSSGETGVITITGIVSPGLAGGSVFTNTAIIESAAADGNTNDNTSQASITIANVAPEAQDDTASTLEDTPVVMFPLNNDFDLNGDSLTLSGLTPSSHGSATINGTTIIYTPSLDFNGEDVFGYTASDGSLSDSALITVTITPVNDPPVGVDDTASTIEDTPVVIPVRANDQDAEGDALMTGIGLPSHGIATSNGVTVTYTPTLDFFGWDVFFYTLSDGVYSDTAVVTVTVIPGENDPPVAVNDVADTDEDVPVTIPVLVNDSDPDADSLVIVAVGDPAHGTSAISGTVIVYSPALDYFGMDVFTYTIGDMWGVTDTAQVIVTVVPVNDPPIAAGDSYTLTEDSPLSVAVPGVLANDTDVDSEILTATLDTGPSIGVLAFNPDGSFVYTPTLDFNGVVTFSYHTSDSTTNSNVAEVILTVTGANDLPVVSAGLNQTTAEGSPVTFSGSFTDPDIGDPHTIGWDFGDGVTVTSALTPTHTFADNGKYTVTLRVTDDEGGVGTDTLLVTVNNVAPNLAALPDLTVTVGEVVSFTEIITDPGWLDSHTIVVTWEPGVTETINLPAGENDFTTEHIFTLPGTYEVQVTVTDKDGAWRQITFQVTINPVYYRVYLPIARR